MSHQNDQYYILLKEHIGKKKEKGLLRTTSSKVDVLPGTLLCLVEEDIRDERLIWVLETVDSDNNHVEISCSPEDTQQLTYNEFRLLLPIPVCQERLSIFQDKTWLNEGANLREGDRVLVSLKGLPDLTGLIRYKGELPSSKGIQFGVELAPEHRGKGTCDGVFRKKRFFTCDINGAVFVAIHKLRKDHSGTPQRHLDQNYQDIGTLPFIDNDEREMIEKSGLKERDRIVWLSDNGPEYGEVKWIGILPDTHRRDVTVGVEFDNPVGSGTGKYKNHRLFHAKPQHASLVPIMGLMKASEYMSTMGATFVEEEEIMDYHPPPVIPEYLTPTRPVVKPSAPPVKQEIVVSAEVHTGGKPLYKNHDKENTQKAYSYPVQNELHSPRKSLEEVAQIQGVNPLYEYQKAQDVDSKQDTSRESFEQPLNRSSRLGSKSLPPPDPDLEIGSMVEVMANPPLYGVIRWIGTLPDQKEPIKPIAGLEMEEEISAGTDGSFGKYKLFTCPPKKAFFVPLYKCRKDKRFVESGGRAGVGNNFGSIETPDVCGNVSPPDSLDEDLLTKVCGKQRGIQGHHNSCYLDATLFAMFYFTTVFDGILYRPKTEEDIADYDEVKQVIKEGIVNPLRRFNYVRADKVMKLRHLLDKLGNIPGMMNEEKDPEEFLNLLLNQITRADPLLHIRQDNCNEIQQSFLYQLFIEKDERLVLPTTQQLFELSFLQSKVKLQERPSCLILQMPRFGKDYKMYKRIVPSMELDITDVLENAPRECIICGDLAFYECKECYNQHGAGLNTIAFCEGCKEMSHRHKVRINHKWQKISVPSEYIELHNQEKQVKGHHPTIPREKLELFAVVCIQTSHYVSFVKCGKGKDAPWVFFDSMADRMGEQSGYNIPEVTYCQELQKWLSEESHNIIIQTQDKELPEEIRRLLCDAYMCLYQSIEVSMFK